MSLEFYNLKMKEIIVPKLGKLFERLVKVYDCSFDLCLEKTKEAIIEAYETRTQEVIYPEVTLDVLIGKVKIFNSKGENITPVEDEDMLQLLSRKILNYLKRWMDSLDADLLFLEFKDLERTIIRGRIIGWEGENVLLSVKSGHFRPKIVGVLPQSEQAILDDYVVGNSLLVYLKSVNFDESDKLSLTFSRVSVNLVAYLLYFYCPEIYDGRVRILSLARETQYNNLPARTKVAVDSLDRDIDPVKVVVGEKGSRISYVREELSGEHIDVVRWSPYVDRYVKESLKPGVIDDVVLSDLHSRKLVVYVKDSLSLSSAIGTKGQNVRLASNLTGWGINIQQS